MKTAIALALAAAFALPALSIAQASDDSRYENRARHERHQDFRKESRDDDGRYAYNGDRRHDEGERHSKRHSERHLERHGDND